MFENRPQSPTGNHTNKIKSYFESSSYLNQQQEISIFMKNFPIIRLNEVASINVLIGLLIKQNQVLAKKCQEDVSLLRESFNKHQTLLRNIKEVKSQNNKLAKENQTKNKLESVIIELKRQIQLQKENIYHNNIKQTCKEQSVKEMKEIKVIVDIFNALSTLFQEIVKQDFRKCENLVKNLDFKGLKTVIKSQYLSQFWTQDGVVQELQKSFKQMRYREKSLKNMKIATSEFCTRLRQILKIVPGQMLKGELDQQVQSFMELLQGIVDSYEKLSQAKGSNTKTNRKQRSNFKSPKSKYNQSSKRSLQKAALDEKGQTLFQNMLSKVVKQYEDTQVKQNITNELQNLKQALSNSKQYYQSFLVSLRKQYENERTAREDQLLVKQQTICYYEKQLKKVKTDLSAAEQENILLIAQVKNKAEQGKQMKETIDELKNSVSKLRQQISDNENLKQRAKQQIWKINEMQVKQRDSFIEQLKALRKSDKEEAQLQLDKVKRKFKQYELQTEALCKDKKAVQKCLQSIQSKLQRKQQEFTNLQNKLQRQQKNVDQLTQQIRRKHSQIDKFKQSLKESEHERVLQTSYIQQLQNKNKNHESKIQNLLDKKNIEKSAKKQLISLKSSLQAQKKHSAGLQQTVNQLKQENHRLKTMIHEMKKELQEVYVRLNNLRQIQQQRERLMFEAQNSQRARDQILNDYEQIKFSVLQIEAENKALQLQVKHYKNAINRMQGISEFVNP